AAGVMSTLQADSTTTGGMIRKFMAVPLFLDRRFLHRSQGTRLRGPGDIEPTPWNTLGILGIRPASRLETNHGEETGMTYAYRGCFPRTSRDGESHWCPGPGSNR